MWGTRVNSLRGVQDGSDVPLSDFVAPEGNLRASHTSKECLELSDKEVTLNFVDQVILHSESTASGPSHNPPYSASYM